MIHYPDRLLLAQLPTPIQALDKFDYKNKNCRLWIKRDDLTGSVTSGNKIRKLEFTLAEAINHSADVVITCGGIQSNHARTTAILAAQLGLKCHLILRGEQSELTPSGNYLLDHLVGATIECHSSSTYVPKFSGLLENCLNHYREQGLKPFFIPTGASDATGVWGYIKACEELKQQCQQSNVHFDHIVCATGSGGTLAGLIAGNEIFELGCKIWGINICDDAAYFVRKTTEDLLAWKQKYHLGYPVAQWPINIIDGYVGAGYSMASEAVYGVITALSRHEGIILDSTYTGKAFHGLLNELERGRFGALTSTSNILFIHTGGIFGLLADKLLAKHLAEID